MPDSAFWSHGSEICFSFLVNFISSYNDTTEVTRLANSYSFNSVVNISVSLFSFLCELIWFFFLIFVWICSGLLFFYNNLWTFLSPTNRISFMKREQLSFSERISQFASFFKKNSTYSKFPFLQAMYKGV